MRVALFAVVGLMASGSALAEDWPSQSRLQAAQAAAPDKPICIHEGVTGSRLEGRKVCRTPGDWLESIRNARSEVEAAQRLASQNNCQPGHGC